jgi:hypothetical protein
VNPVPILWLHDVTTGTGKSGIGWELLVGTSGDGIKTAYVDLEYVSAFAPARAGDPGNHRLKLDVLAALWPAYRSDGVRCLVAFSASGVVEVAETLRETIPESVVTTCRTHDSHAALAESDASADVTVDVNGRDLADVAAIIRAAARDWPFGDLEGSC